MGEINVPGIGRVQIAGTEPTPEEADEILKFLETDKPAEKPAAPGKTESSFKSGYPMVGSLAGAALGAPAGPAGILGGGALGAAAGTLVGEHVDDILRRFGALEGKAPDAIERAISAAKAAMTDAGWSGGAMAAGSVFAKPFSRMAGQMMGLRSDAARKIEELASGMGVGLGAAHVSPRGAVKGFPGVVGVFPWAGGPIRKGQEKVTEQVTRAGQNLLDELGPTSTKFDVSGELYGAARGRYRSMATESTKNYDKFYALADRLPVQDIVPADPLKKVAAEWAAEQSRGAIPLTAGGQMRNPAEASQNVRDMMADIAKFPDFISPNHARAFERSLNLLSRSRPGLSGADTAAISKVQSAIRQAADNMDFARAAGNGEEGAILAIQARDQWKRANEYHEKFKSTFETATAQKFGSVERKGFKAGIKKPGAREVDELIDRAFNARSPDAMRNLRSMVGGDTFNKAARSWIDGQFRAAMIPGKEGGIVGDIFSAADFEKRLGLGTPEGDVAFAEMLKGTGLKPERFKQFLEVAKNATDITIRDPSTFVTRRMMIGAGLAGSAVIGAGHMTIPAAVMVTILARGAAKKLMSPDFLQAASAIYKTNATDQIKHAALARLLNYAGPPEKKDNAEVVR